MSPTDRSVTAAFMAASLLLTDCASVGKVIKSNAFIGASLGGMVGATTGAVIGSPESAVPGSFIGAASGIAFGALVGGIITAIANRNEQKQLDVPLSIPGPLGADEPKLTQPLVQKVWQDDKIEDGRYIQGHYIWVLERGSVWSMP